MLIKLALSASNSLKNESRIHEAPNANRETPKLRNYNKISYLSRSNEGFIQRKLLQENFAWQSMNADLRQAGKLSQMQGHLQLD